MNTQSRSRWMLKVLLVFVTVTLLAGQPLLPALAMPLGPVDRVSAPNAPSAALTVNTTDDELNADGDCSLREAIESANNDTGVDACTVGSGLDTITFSVTGTIFLTSTLPLIDDDVTIDGGNTITIDGVSLYRVMDVNVGMTVNLTALTIANGLSTDGGGIFNSGTLTVTNSTFSGNRATSNGGGIYNGAGGTVTVINSTFSGNAAGNDVLASGGGFFNLGTLTVMNSTFSNNTARFYGSGGYNGGTLTVTGSTFVTNSSDTGGGIYNNVGSTATINNSTFTGNSVTLYGGGVYNLGTLPVINSTFNNNASGDLGAGIYTSGTLTVTNSTFSTNLSSDFGGGMYNAAGGTATINNSTFISNTASSTSGGGIYNLGSVTLQNTIVAGSAGDDCAVGAGTLTADAFNLDSDGTCASATQHTMPEINLGPLTNNGGPTQTRALLPGSVAIDAGSDLVCAATDQRGVPRPQGPHCDVGAFELNQYTLTINTAGNGSGVVTPTVGSHFYITGTLVPITATANTGSTFTGWSGDLTGTTNPTDITMNGNKVVTATFTLNTFVITPTAGANGSITPGTPQTVNYGDSITFTIAANTGYHIADVGVDGISQGAISSYTFSNVTADHTITAAFAINTYVITPTAGANGSITPGTPQTVNYGDSITFTIAANTGYHIADVGVDGISQGALSSYTFNNVTADHTITATFAINTYVITPTAGANGSITPGTPQTVNFGDSITFTIAADTGYHIVDVGVDGISQGAISSYAFFNVAADHIITATFEINAPNTFTLTVNKAGNGDGTVTLNPPGPTYIAGTVVTLTATPLISSTFTGWSGAVNGTTNPITLTMDADKTVTATFALNTYTLTVATTGTGSGVVSPTVGAHPYDYGTIVTLTATANTGSTFAGWSGNADCTDGLVTMDANKSCTATFTLNPPTGLSATNNSPTALGSGTTLTATVTGGINLTYAWNFGDGSFGAGATITHTYAAAGTYTAVVTATNSAGSLTATTTVYVTTNPIANAGPDQTVRTGRSVTLNGSASSDPGNFLPLTYHWQQTGGPAVTLTGANNVTATFTAPVVTQTQVLTFALTVTNTQSIASLPDVVVITVEPYRVMLPIVMR